MERKTAFNSLLSPEEEELLNQEAANQSVIDAPLEANLPDMANYDLKLQEARNTAERNNLLTAANAFASGITSGNAIRPDLAPANAVLARMTAESLDSAEDPNRIAKSRVEQLKTKTLFDDEKELTNPTSLASQVYRDLVKEKFPNMQIPDGITAKRLQSIFPNLVKGDPLAAARLELLRNEHERKLRQGDERISHSKDRFGYQKEEKFEDDAQKALKDLRSRESFKESEKILNALNKIDLLIKDATQKGGQSLAMLGPVIAKGLAGEVGVLTEADVVRYVQSPQLATKIYDQFLKNINGKLSSLSAENLVRLANIMRDAAVKRKDALIDEEAELFSRREKGLSKQEARYLLDSIYKKPSTGKLSADKRQEAINRAKQANPNLSEEKVIEQLKSRGIID
jgi:hypothetical protein